VKTTLIAIALAAATTMAVTPAYRAAQTKKPAATKEAAAKPAAPQAGQPGVVASATQSAADGSGATF
jgi:hypothetical protein